MPSMLTISPQTEGRAAPDVNTILGCASRVFCVGYLAAAVLLGRTSYVWNWQGHRAAQELETL